MKTTLIDVVKVNGTGNNSNASRIKSSTPKRVEQKSFRSTADDSQSSFNKTLKEEQKSSESKFEVTSKKPEKTTEKAVKKEDVKETEAVKEQDEAIAHEPVEDTNTESEMAEKASEQGAVVQTREEQTETVEGKVTLKEEGEDTTVESAKTKTLMTLLSNVKQSKLPNVERYISNLRNEGKSTQEILTSLNRVVNELEETGEATLKDYVLKAKKILTEETTAVEEKTGNTSEKQAVILTPQKTEAVEENKTEMKQTDQNQPELITKTIEKETGESQEKKTVVKDEAATSVRQVVIKPETKVATADVQTDKTVQMNAEQVKKTTQNQSKAETETTAKTNQNTEIVIPEKLIKFLENFEKVDVEKISSFFESELIPLEEIERFVESFTLDSAEDFVQKNESVLSQLSEFSNIFKTTHSNIFNLGKTVTVKSSTVQQFLVKTFSERSFSDDFWNSRSTMTFKTKNTAQAVQKMTLMFEKVTQSVRTEVRQTQTGLSTLTSREGEVRQENGSDSDKTLVKAAFLRTGYASPISRRGSLAQTVEQTPVQSEETPKKTEVFQSPLKQIDELKATVEKVQSRGTENTDSKDFTESKETKANTNGEQMAQSGEKTTGSTSTTTLNRQVANSVNLDQIYQRINDMTKLMERQVTKVETATIQLTPPELGKVSLEVVKEGSRISIFMQVETKDAQEVLQRNSEALATRLAGSGFEVQKVQVQMEKYEEQGTDQQNQNANSQNDQNGENNENNSNEAGSDYDTEVEYSFADLLKGGTEDAG